MKIARRESIRNTAIKAARQIDSNPYDSIEFFRTTYEIREIFLFSEIGIKMFDKAISLSPNNQVEFNNFTLPFRIFSC